MEDSRLGFGGEGLPEDGERPSDLRQRLLTLERCPILEHLDGNERVTVGEISGDVEADDAIQCSTSAVSPNVSPVTLKSRRRNPAPEANSRRHAAAEFQVQGYERPH